MKFDRLRIAGFKCHEQADLTLDTGVTVIHGVNGSGKSSLLEACFFGLYGTKALDSTLDEVVTIGAEQMSVELWFTHDGADYRIERQVRVTDGNARTSKCVLEGPEGTIEGVTDVREQVEALLRMDHEAFRNCAYVRQGEVNKLINASPSVRQDMLDDLLQLGRLEEYRDRASDARIGVGRVRDDKQGALEEIESQIGKKEDRDLHDRRNQLASRRDAVVEDIERFEENREKARKTVEEANELLAEYEEKQAELDDLEDEIATVRERIQETADEREELAEKVGEHREALKALRQRREELLDAASIDVFEDEPELQAVVEEAIERLRVEREELTEEIRSVSIDKQELESERSSLIDSAEDLEAQAETKRDRAAELEADIETALADLEGKRDRLAALRASKREVETAFEDGPVAVGTARDHRKSVVEALDEAKERRTEVRTELESERERLAEAKSLKAAGKCPECGQAVEDSPHVDAIDERTNRVEELEATLEDVEKAVETQQERLATAEEFVEKESELDRLDSERENLLTVLAERARGVRDKQQQVERLVATAEEHETAAGDSRERATELAEEIEKCKSAIAEYNKEKGQLADRLEHLETLADVLADIERRSSTLASLREKRADRKEVNDERRERLQSLRKRREELEDSFEDDRIERAQQKRSEAQDYLEDVEAKLDELEEQRAELQSHLGGVENELEELASLRERREELAGTVEDLESLYEEASQLQELYGQLRAELRQQNVTTLERMLNETFDLLYENDTYARIELDGEYRLTVYQKDGSQLDPAQLSGGERAIFNLSLRCAIYRLLAEGIEGAAPMPPLILDEPTVFLDATHVSQLLALIDAMYDLGVAQILVVSHDEELVAAADDLVTVRKNATTNRSSVERSDGTERLVTGASD